MAPKFFVDFRIKPESPGELRRMLRAMSRLGYRLVLLDIESNVDVDDAVKAARDAGVRLLTRVTVRASTRREARLKLDGAPRADVVVLEALELDAARYGAANKRVHAVRIPLGGEKFVDKGEARILRAKGFGGVEVSLGYAVKELGERELKFYFTVFRRAFAYRIPLAISSDAQTVYDLWEPVTAAAFASKIAGIPFSSTIRWLASSPAWILRGFK